jgi:hypothetical protein
MKKTIIIAALMSLPAYAQWYDTTEVPGGVGDILQPFNLKGYNLGTGADVSVWLAPGSDPKYTGLSFLLRGGATLSETPLYFGVEVPLAYWQTSASGQSASQFVIGDVGLGVKYRLDPFKKELELYTGWSLDVYLPTSWLKDDAITSVKQLAALGVGTANSLMAAMFLPEAMAIVGSFDVIMPGRIVTFQFELAPAAFIPVSETDKRDTAGALFWGAMGGLQILKELAWIVEFKGYTPFNMKDAYDFMAFSTGLRLRLGLFQPAVWVTIPINSDYRKASADAIIGANIALWF